jgi:hypothetical protein
MVSVAHVQEQRIKLPTPPSITTHERFFAKPADLPFKAAIPAAVSNEQHSSQVKSSS